MEAISARAVALALAGRDEQAQAAAEESERLAGRLHYPVGQAAKAEAAGAAAEDPAVCASEIEEARTRWLELGRPLDAARCLLVRGRLLAKQGSEDADEVLAAAAEEYEELNAPALASSAREPVA